LVQLGLSGTFFGGGGSCEVGGFFDGVGRAVGFFVLVFGLGLGV
jgi:hypothetical protein